MSQRHLAEPSTCATGEQSPRLDVDDAFRALLEGLRTTLPGVQVLFAFLLALPLQSAFSALSDLQRGAYFAAFVSSALSSVLLIAPSAHQRLRAPDTGVHRRSERHLSYAVRFAIAGTAAFAVALVAAVFLVASLLVSAPEAMAITIVVAVLAAWTWFYVPLVTFRRLA